MRLIKVNDDVYINLDEIVSITPTVLDVRIQMTRGKPIVINTARGGYSAGPALAERIVAAANGTTTESVLS